jgi:GTP:adenosylcobinamide-phosphate guanylyltransferase
MTRRRQAESQTVKERHARLRLVFASGQEIVTDSQPYTVQDIEDLRVSVSKSEVFAVVVGDDMVLVNPAHVESIGVAFHGPSTTRSL